MDDVGRRGLMTRDRALVGEDDKDVDVRLGIAIAARLGTK